MDDNDDDNVSLVSPSPSPAPMDVDTHDTSKYDEYVPGYEAPERITVDTRIPASNKGFSMLAKLGWKEGTPLGLSDDARVDPVPFSLKNDGTGIGKVAQDARVIAETVAKRRQLDSVRQQNETEEHRRLREDEVARASALQIEISSTLRAFYCELCDKQFKNVAQYDEHTNSYAHHHKARAKDMQANVRVKNQADIDKAKEKERKREEKELRKMAAAAGIKMPKPGATPAQTGPALVPVEPLAKASGGFKKSGWASVQGGGFSSSNNQPAASSFSNPGASDQRSTFASTPQPPHPAPAPDNPPPPPPPMAATSLPNAPLSEPPRQSSWQQFQHKVHKRR